MTQEKFSKAKLAKALAEWKRASKALGRLRELEEAEKIPERKKSIGRCFKFRNSYGGDREKWWLYVRIVGLTDSGSMFRVHEIQNDGQGHITIEATHLNESMVRNWDYIPITAEEYQEGIRPLFDEFGPELTP